MNDKLNNSEYSNVRTHYDINNTLHITAEKPKRIPFKIEIPQHEQKRDLEIKKSVDAEIVLSEGEDEFSDEYDLKKRQLWLSKAQELHLIKKTIKKWQAREQELAEQLQYLSGRDSYSVGDFKYERYDRPGSVNYKDIPELKGVDLNRYRNPFIMCWRLVKE
jgi:hypothetical protein